MVYAESRGSFPSGMASGFLSLADRSAFLYYRPPPKKLRCITLKVRRQLSGMYSGMPNAPPHFHGMAGAPADGA